MKGQNTMTNNCMSIKVEMEPGATIENAAEQSCALATKLGCDIDFNFNGVHCVAQPNGDPKEMIGMFFLVLSSATSHKFAFAHSHSRK